MLNDTLRCQKHHNMHIAEVIYRRGWTTSIIVFYIASFKYPFAFSILSRIQKKIELEIITYLVERFAPIRCGSATQQTAQVLLCRMPTYLGRYIHTYYVLLYLRYLPGRAGGRGTRYTPGVALAPEPTSCPYRTRYLR